MHPLIEKFIAGQLPEPMAQALVGGALPLPPGDLLHGLAHAVFHETPFASKAAATLQAMPESLLAGVLEGGLESPDALGLVIIYRSEPALQEAALLQPNLTAVWMERVVQFLPGTLLDLPLNNQRLWIERPRILDLIQEHPEAEYQHRRRINEFRLEVLHQITEEAAREHQEILDEVQAGHLDKAWAELPPPEPESEEERAERERALQERLAKTILDADGHEVSLSLTQRVLRLTTSQKIMLAIKGGKEERTLLIREANRLIQVNVIRNGRITEGEVAYIAQMRQVNEEVLRIISMNREWMKKYTIVKNLVHNPRTPLPLAMSLVKRLVEPDMKLLMKDRNVSEALRKEAKRIIEQKTKGN